MTKPISIDQLDQEGKDYLAGMQSLLDFCLLKLNVSEDVKTKLVFNASAEGQRQIQAVARTKELKELFSDAVATVQSWASDNWSAFLYRQDEWSDAVMKRYQDLIEPEDYAEMQQRSSFRFPMSPMPLSLESLDREFERLQRLLQGVANGYSMGPSRDQRIAETKLRITEVAKYRAELIAKQMDEMVVM